MPLEGLKRRISLRDFTTIKIGGEAKYFFVVDNDEELRSLVSKLDNFYILGKGSNLLVKDSLIDTPIIKLGKGYNYIKQKEGRLEIGAATTLASILNYCLKYNWGGFSNLAGIPASLGGLLLMNASSFGKEASLYLEELEVMAKTARIIRIKKEDLIFGYRFSSLGGYIILRAWFKAFAQKNLKEEISFFLKRRYSSQDFTFPNCGCVFKNPAQLSAAFLIDACGLKGLSRNDAQVSLRHANFIINRHRATYNDVDYLIGIIKDKVYQRFGVVLEEEIERWA